MDLRLEGLHIARQRRELRHERLSLLAAKQEFEKRMEKFRCVCTASWDAVFDPSTLPQLKKALEDSEHLWEGFAGCVRDYEDVPAEFVAVA